MIKFMLPLSLLAVFVMGHVLVLDITRDSRASEISNRKLPISMTHDHSPLATDDWDNIPEISLNISVDPMTQGWNLRVDSQYFAFTPEDVNKPGQRNTGHAHLYINGVKASRLYSPWTYLNQLPAGTYVLRVTLNSNMHEELTVNGQAISAQQTIVQH